MDTEVDNKINKKQKFLKGWFVTTSLQQLGVLVIIILTWVHYSQRPSYELKVYCQDNKYSPILERCLAQSDYKSQIIQTYPNGEKKECPFVNGGMEGMSVQQLSENLFRAFGQAQSEKIYQFPISEHNLFILGKYDQSSKERVKLMIMNHMVDSDDWSQKVIIYGFIGQILLVVIKVGIDFLNLTNRVKDINFWKNEKEQKEFEDIRDRIINNQKISIFVKYLGFQCSAWLAFTTFHQHHEECFELHMNMFFYDFFIIFFRCAIFFPFLAVMAYYVYRANDKIKNCCGDDNTLINCCRYYYSFMYYLVFFLGIGGLIYFQLFYKKNKISLATLADTGLSSIWAGILVQIFSGFSKYLSSKGYDYKYSSYQQSSNSGQTQVTIEEQDQNNERLL